LLLGRDTERREHEDGDSRAIVGLEDRPTHDDVADEPVAALRHERQLWNPAGRVPDRRDQRRDSGVVEGGELEDIDRTCVMRRFRTDPDLPVVVRRQATPPETAERRPSGGAARC